jgi:hypothetical protein
MSDSTARAPKISRVACREELLRGQICSRGDTTYETDFIDIGPAYTVGKLMMPMHVGSAYPVVQPV